MSERVLEEFQLSSEVFPANVCVRGITGCTLGVNGTTYVTLKFGNIKFPLQFVVVKGYHSFPGHLLLGHNFLYRSGMVL